MANAGLAYGQGASLAGRSLLWLLALGGVGLTSQYSFLLFHSLAEIFSIVVAMAVFLLAWNARRFMDDGYLLFLGLSCLFVAGVDLLHALAYKGMGVFPGASANLATQLWITARYLQTLAFLIAPWYVDHRLRPGFWLATWSLVTVPLLMAIFTGRFPDCFLEGQGLTPFKIYSEYLIVASLALAAAWLWRRRQGLDRRVLVKMLAAHGLSMASELAFTTYVNIFGPALVVGHLLKIMAFVMIYQAVIVIGLRRPYDLLFRELKQGEEALRLSEQTARTLLNAPHESAVLLDMEGAIVAINEVAARDLDGSPEDMVGRRASDFLPPQVASSREARIRQAMQDGQGVRFEDQRDGRWFDIAAYPIFDEQGQPWRVAIFGQDITQRKRHEEERERLLAQLQKALAEVKTLSGLLPICAHCKRIRDDQGYWERIESYISQHSQAQFTHGICPECAKKLYPELMG
ncbi:MAG: PAS domain-containing protein [Desulfarculus sp.]|nr:PAS domain-containing protein [Desulfarculus sp.]